MAAQLTRLGDEHAVQPGAVTITQSTELGTRYTATEIAALADAAHQHGLRLHVDGARLANAAAGLNADLRAITADAGVDLLSLGGTKNGMLLFGTGGSALFFAAAQRAHLGSQCGGPRGDILLHIELGIHATGWLNEPQDNFVGGRQSG